MVDIGHGYRIAKNCIPIRVTRLKNCVYIVAPTHVEVVCLLSKFKLNHYVEIELKLEGMG